MIPRGGDGYCDVFMTSLFLDSLMVVIFYCVYYLEWARAEQVSSAFSALSTDFRYLSDQIYPEYWACFYFDIAAPLPFPGEWYCEATQSTALHGKYPLLAARNLSRRPALHGSKARAID